MRHNLEGKGLSLSQAQSISNLCHQRASEISNTLVGINNASKTLKLGEQQYIETAGKKLPDNVTELLMEKSKLHATQAFLMTNIKAKDELLKAIIAKKMVNDLRVPERPELRTYKPEQHVDEQWGWDQLTPSEYSEFIEAEAYAAHIGQFIHKGSILDKLRQELPTIKTLEWINVKDGERTPLIVTIHHNSEDLLKVHENLATQHRKYEMRVNYFKAKAKNLVTEENARISRDNGINVSEVNKHNDTLNSEFTTSYSTFQGLLNKAREEFEVKRQEEIKTTAALRISVDPRFQETVDMYLNYLGTE